MRNNYFFEKRKLASKDYKKEINKQFKKYQSNLNHKLRNLKSKDPKMYWKIINGSN